MVKVKHSFGMRFECHMFPARIASLCDDGCYGLLYENDAVASVVRWLFWERKPFSFVDLDRMIMAVVDAPKKMLRIDLQMEEERNALELRGDSLGKQISSLGDRTTKIEAMLKQVLKALGEDVDTSSAPTNAAGRYEALNRLAGKAQRGGGQTTANPPRKNGTFRRPDALRGTVRMTEYHRGTVRMTEYHRGTVDYGRGGSLANVDDADSDDGA